MWFLYSFLGLIFLWLWDFTKKVVLKKWWNKEVFLFMCFIFYIITLWINYYISSEFIVNYKLLHSALIMWFFDFMAPIALLTALKNLDSSFAFIAIRITASFFILYIWTRFLWDNLSIYNIIWFFIWVIAIYFLSWFNFKEKHKINKKWLLAVLITIIWIVWSHSYFKFIVPNLEINSFMFFKFWFSFLFIILYMTLRKKFKYFNKTQIKKVTPYALFSCFIFITYFLYLIPNIYILWPLSLWYKFLSYSIIVPIILSIILYKEKVSFKRLIAFILTIISIALFLF